jgi:hypothetical protein
VKKLDKKEMRMFILMGEIVTLIFFVFVTFMIDIRFRVELFWGYGGVLGSVGFYGILLGFLSLIGVLLCFVAIYDLYYENYFKGAIFNLIGGITISITYISVAVGFIFGLNKVLSLAPPGGSIEQFELLSNLGIEFFKILFSLIGLILLQGSTVGYIILAIRGRREGKKIVGTERGLSRRSLLIIVSILLGFIALGLFIMLLPLL